MYVQTAITVFNKRQGADRREVYFPTCIRSASFLENKSSGEWQYIAPYARRQYYNTSPTRSYDSRRGGMWFERMKTAHRTQILKLVSK